ncbi:trypsin-like peptidase domain-containing protein [Pseudorhodoferax sp.]|uniref:trypsin-like peptidase domain-containing protein n=1 Tax=Pseudorhodoferax sp. TaxID=1993553 RepID=UPI002DD647A9|nr:trypsin-like peptidase domain-containing protein [Pseudorhodoferax sp.]
MSFKGYLTLAQIREVQQALIDAGLFKPDAQEAMRSAVAKSYQGLLPISTTPNIQLFLTLTQLNGVHNLVNGDVPLAQFLEVAALLAASDPSVAVIEKALDRIRYDAPPAPAPAMAPMAAADAGAGAAINTDVELQAQTGALDQTIGVRFLRDGLAAAASVVKVLVHRHMDGHPEFLDGDAPRLVNGTGWIIAPGLLVTNHHVVNARRKEGVQEPDASPQDFRLQAEHTRVLFDYIEAEAVDTETGPGALLYSNAALDFALLRLPASAPARPPLRLRSHLIRKTKIQALGTAVNLLQHPNGKPMRLGFRNNYVVAADEQRLSYLTDTAVGSSGSPVCDDAWAVAGLHCGSQAISVDGIEILGQRYRRENYGVPIAAILAHLQDAAPALRAEIAAGQQTLG